MSFGRCWACYWQCLFRGELGQSYAIGMVPLVRGQANSMLLVAPLWSHCRPSAAHHSVGSRPIPCHWQCLFQGELGQSHAVGMVSLERGWANSKPLVASPWSNSGPSAACHLAGAGPIPCHWPCLFQGKLGQSHAIGIVSLESSFATRSALNVLSFTANGLELARCCFNLLLAWPSLFYGIS